MQQPSAFELGPNTVTDARHRHLVTEATEALNLDGTQKIEEVFKRWTPRLKSIRGVMGVAIGLSKDKKQKVIKVYLNQKHTDQTPNVPRQIEGFAVEIEIRSSFRAF